VPLGVTSHFNSDDDDYDDIIIIITIFGVYTEEILPVLEAKRAGDRINYTV